jgi:hypothetical protein
MSCVVVKRDKDGSIFIGADRKVNLDNHLLFSSCKLNETENFIFATVGFTDYTEPFSWYLEVNPFGTAFLSFKEFLDEKHKEFLDEKVDPDCVSNFDAIVIEKTSHRIYNWSYSSKTEVNCGSIGNGAPQANGILLDETMYGKYDCFTVVKMAICAACIGNACCGSGIDIWRCTNKLVNNAGDNTRNTTEYKILKTAFIEKKIYEEEVWEEEVCKPLLI